VSFLIDEALTFIIYKYSWRRNDEIEGPRGERELDLKELFTDPGTTALSPGEVITSFFLLKVAARSWTAYCPPGPAAGSGADKFQGTSTNLQNLA
jgi:hypothetical protein